MGENNIKKIHKKAKAYKKFAEKIAVYPYPYEEAGINYYFVDYILMRKPTGSAVFSIEMENMDRIKKAHENLYMFYGYSGKLENEAIARLQVDLKYYREPLALMDAHSNGDWKEAYA